MKFNKLTAYAVVLSSCVAVPSLAWAQSDAVVTDDEDIVVASAIQGPDDVAADETRPTGHDDHANS